MSLNNEGRRGSTQAKKLFSDLSDRQKNRRVEELITSELDQLLLASAKSAKMSNEDDLEFVLRLMYKDHEQATRIRNLLKAEKSMVEPKKLVPLRGLTYLLDNNMTAAQYMNTRLISKEYGSNIFPSYNKIAEAKQECRPPVQCTVNDVSATLPLQALLNHTAHRLLLLQEPVVSKFKNANIFDIKIKLQVKWGSDGSADHSQYNQKYVNVESTVNSDANFFATTLVPLRMTTEDDWKLIIWNNATPQSSRWCRPLRLHFAKETDEFTMEEINFVRGEIASLEPFIITISGVQLTIVFELYLTMIDGKVLATIMKTKSKQTCSICQATPKEFNNLDNMEIRFKPKEGSLNYGLSVLHLWIRCFEWLLHISYRLKFKKWQIRGPKLKAKAKARKMLLQKRFFEKMTIRVDFPSTGGCGNSNNGNVCRTAFSNTKLLSEILEVNEKLIENVKTILIALSCQLPLNVDRFHEFCIATSHHNVKHYKWFPFPQSVHKALIHSRDILLANDLTVGVLAEDASESCNKLYRQNRQFHARKNSRQNNLQDVFNRALDSSDPLVASFGLRKRQNARIRKNIPKEVLNLLQTPDEPEPMQLELEEIEEVDITEVDKFEDGLSDEFVGALDELTIPEDTDTYYEQLENDSDDEHCDCDEEG